MQVQNRNDLIRSNELFSKEALEKTPLDSEQEKLLSQFKVNKEKARGSYRLAGIDRHRISKSEYELRRKKGEFKKIPKLTEEEKKRELTEREKYFANKMRVRHSDLLKQEHIWTKQKEQGFVPKAERQAQKSKNELRNSKWDSKKKKYLNSEGKTWSNIRQRWEKPKN